MNDAIERDRVMLEAEIRSLAKANKETSYHHKELEISPDALAQLSIQHEYIDTLLAQQGEWNAVRLLKVLMQIHVSSDYLYANSNLPSSSNNNFSRWLKDIEKDVNWLASKEALWLSEKADKRDNQTAGPYKFVFHGENLTTEKQISVPKRGALVGADASYRVLLAQGEDVQIELAASNHSRLMRAFAHLFGALTANRSIIEIGLHEQFFQQQIMSSSEELSPGMQGLLNAFCGGVRAFVSQFQDWQEFSANASEATSSNANWSALADFARTIADELKGRESVDAKVPDALEHVAVLVSTSIDPAAKKALSSTVNNLIKACYQKLVLAPLSYIGDTATKAVICIVLLKASRSIEIIAGTPEGSWLKGVVDLINRRIQNL